MDLIKNLFILGVGVNSRLDTIQAIILNLKLKDLNKNNLKRKKISNIYSKKLKINMLSNLIIQNMLYIINM